MDVREIHDVRELRELVAERLVEWCGARGWTDVVEYEELERFPGAIVLAAHRGAERVEVRFSMRELAELPSRAVPFYCALGLARAIEAREGLAAGTLTP